MSAPETTTPSPTTTDPAKWEAIFRGVVQVLSLRAILLLALGGAFVLALRSMGEQTVFSLVTLAIYCVCAIFPVAYLEIRRHT